MHVRSIVAMEMEVGDPLAPRLVDDHSHLFHQINVLTVSSF